MNKMKLGLTALAVCAIQVLATAGPGNMPRAVNSAFTRQHPGAHVINCEMRNNEYIVNFRNSSENASAYYLSDGTWLRTDTKIADKKDLPEKVQDGLTRSDYGKYSVEQIDKVLQPTGKTVYMLHVTSGADVENDRVLYFNPEGRLETVTGTPIKASEEQ